MTSNREKWMWVAVSGMWINDPFLTYQVFKYTDIPPVKILPEFEHLKSLQALKQYFEENKNSWFEMSPTSSYLNFEIEDDFNNTVFFRDQQDCVRWTLNSSDGTVYINGNPESIVAASLPEFLTRITFENESWFKQVQVHTTCWHCITKEAQEYAKSHPLLERSDKCCKTHSASALDGLINN